MKKNLKPNTFDCSQNVMEKIHTEHIHMKPSWLFYIGSATVIFGISTFMILASILFSLIWYQSLLMGFSQLIRFGSDGWLIFMTRLPWFAVGASFLVALIGWWLVQHSEYGFHYRKRVVGSAIFTAIIVSSLLLHRTNLWDRILRDSTWERVGRPPAVEEEQVLAGRLLRKNQDLYQLLHTSNQVIPIRFAQLQQNTPTAYIPMIGDNIIILGEWKDGIFEVRRFQIWLKETE
ncbi:MAG TPA: hypothetical protein PKH60_03050 [Candidatus Woesebacteria bacterium]|nr:hypothetical protein [Candidatus Woesebacteria bacterium]